MPLRFPFAPKILDIDLRQKMTVEPYQLTATEALHQIKAGDLTVEAYAQSLLNRIHDRDEVVQAWAYLDQDYVIKQAKALDALPPSERGPLHGIAIAVKDVIYTKGETTILLL